MTAVVPPRTRNGPAPLHRVAYGCVPQRRPCVPLLVRGVATMSAESALPVIVLCRHEFGVPRDTVCSWLLMQLLDGSHASEAGVVSLQQAVALAPSVNGSTLPSKAAAVFQQHMRGDVALRLLRQCRPSTAATALSEACNAVGARLANGLLVEAYIVLKEHLAAVPGTERRIHAKVLMEQLLGWASQFGCVNTIIRLHFEGEEEEVRGLAGSFLGCCCCVPCCRLPRCCHAAHSEL